MLKFSMRRSNHMGEGVGGCEVHKNSKFWGGVGDKVDIYGAVGVNW